MGGGEERIVEIYMLLKHFATQRPNLLKTHKKERTKINVLSHQIFRQVAELLDLIFILFYFSCLSSGRDAKEQ